MVRDSFFRMSMQKPLQHSFVYGSVWPTILKGNEKGKRDRNAGILNLFYMFSLRNCRKFSSSSCFVDPTHSQVIFTNDLRNEE